MLAKIANVVDCLKTEPLSKRAVIPIPFNSEGSETVDWRNQGQTKCCRELHLYLEDGYIYLCIYRIISYVEATHRGLTVYTRASLPRLLKCTGIVRMQNANIFVKNIHFFATLLAEVAEALGVELGEYTHWITNLCFDRDATSC